jgi:RNA polymerase sigma-70 factor (ECF subfamily)
MAPDERPVTGDRDQLAGAIAASSSDELQLVSAIRRSDRKATAQFVSRYADTIYGYVNYRLAPRADLVEDVVQDVFLAALASLASFQGTSSLRTWLLGIARHKVEDHYRRRLRAAEPLDEHAAELPADTPLPDEALDRDRAREKAQYVLQQLEEGYRLVLLWRYWDHRSVRDIADATGKTEKAVERMLARARARFRTLWERR